MIIGSQVLLLTCLLQLCLPRLFHQPTPPFETLIMAYSSLGSCPLVISHNVRGLNVPERRSSLLRELKKGRPHFVFLQETHFRTHHVPRLSNSHFPGVFHVTNNDSKLKGVTIFVSRDAPFQITDQMSDPGGRFLFIKGMYEGSPMTLVNVYFPQPPGGYLQREVVHHL